MLAAMTTVTHAKVVKTANESAATTITQDDSKAKIDPATLPDPVKATLAGDTYKDWQINGAWIVKADPLYYTVELKKDGKTTTVNIDATGKVK